MTRLLTGWRGLLQKNKKILKVAFSAVIVFAVLCCLSKLKFVSFIETKTYDSRMKVASRHIEVSDEISVVLVNQESLNWAKKERGWSWPWPREAYAEIVKYFSKANAKVLAFDMIYSEDSVYGKDDDFAFAKASHDYGKVIQTVYYENENSTEGTYPIEEIKNSSVMIGNVTSTLDKEDRVLRRNLFFTKAGNHEPSLAVASLMVTDSLPDLEKIPLSSQGGMYIKFVDDIARFAPYSAKSILDPLNPDEIPQEQFEDSYVFFALYAPGLFDVCATPVSSAYPGVGLHLCQLNQFLNEDYIAECPPFLFVIILALSVLVGFLLALSVKQAKTYSLPLVTFFSLLICAVYIFSSYLIFMNGLILPLVLPVAALILSYLTAVFEDYLTEGHQKRFIKSAFKHYLSPEVIEQLIENPSSLHLGGEEKEITAYFSDVQGFTSISENLTPAELTELLNIYLSAMTDIIQSYGGYVDKYEGDAIVAFFGAPVDQKDNASRAVKAAMACQEKLVEMQEDLVKISKKPFVQRIGLNSGKAIVGNMGSKNRFNYTMMGDTVNLASRLEGMNKQFGTFTMCSKSTMKNAVSNDCGFSFRKLADIAVVGKKKSVEVFVPMKNEDFEAGEQIFSVYDSAYSLFRHGNFEEAKKLFSLISDKDAPAKKFVKKCEKMIQNPPEIWDGILRATEK